MTISATNMVKFPVDLIVYDFDGVFTDNRVWLTQDGIEAVICNRADGQWVNEFRKTGIEQALLSTEKNPVVARRGEKLKLPVYQGIEIKLPVLREIAAKAGVSLERTCYVGNDINDLECIKAVGFSACPKDSNPVILESSKIILDCKGGEGIVPFLYRALQSLS